MFNIQINRGSTSQNDTHLGIVATMSFDETLSQLRLHDGTTPGGHKVSNDMSLTELNETIANLDVEGINGLSVALAAKVAFDQLGTANGVASLDVNAQIPAIQLPSYVDDILSFGDFSAFPALGETGKIYIAEDNGYVYRWDANNTEFKTVAIQPESSDDLIEGTLNLFYSDSLVREALSGTGGVVYDSATGLINVTESITTVNGKEGAVSLNAEDLGVGELANNQVAAEPAARAMQDPNLYMTPLATRQSMDRMGMGELANGNWGNSAQELPSVPYWENLMLVGSDGSRPTDFFGSSVAVAKMADKTIAVSGSYLYDGIGDDNTNSGSVTILRSNTGFMEELQTITPPDAQANDWFGDAVAISKDATLIAIGAHGEDGDAGVDSQRGSVYLYAWNSTSEEYEFEQKLTGLVDGERFGSSVIIDSTTPSLELIVGSQDHEAGKGIVRVFRKLGAFQQVKTLQPPAGDGAPLFGEVTALSEDGSTLVVSGRLYDQDGNNNVGVSYTYDKVGDEWINMLRVVSPVLQTDTFFSWNVSLNADGTKMLISAGKMDGGAGTITDSGHAFLVDRTSGNWDLEQKFVSETPVANERFGFSSMLSRDGKIVTIGVPGATVDGKAMAGRVDVYVKEGSEWNFNNSVYAGNDSESSVADQRFGERVFRGVDDNNIIIGVYDYSSLLASGDNGHFWMT